MQLLNILSSQYLRVGESERFPGESSGSVGFMLNSLGGGHNKRFHVQSGPSNPTGLQQIVLAQAKHQFTHLFGIGFAMPDTWSSVVGPHDHLSAAGRGSMAILGHIGDELEYETSAHESLLPDMGIIACSM